MQAPRKNKINALALSLICAFGCATAFSPNANAEESSFGTVAETLTLENLKNGSYQIPDSACGFKVVKLNNGKGDNQGLEVVFGRALFGKLSDKQEPGAAVHLAYKDEMFGWMQQVVFVVARGNKLLQIAELGIDEREQVKNLEIRDGDVLIETSLPETKAGKVIKKCTKAQLLQRKEGCELTASEFSWYTTEGDHEPGKRLASLRR